MVRQQSPLLLRTSHKPASKSGRLSEIASFKSRRAPTGRPVPLTSAGQVQRGARGHGRPGAAARDNSIFDTTEVLRELDWAGGGADAEAAQPSAGDNEDDSFDWDDPETLVGMLGDRSPTSSQGGSLELVNELGPALRAMSPALAHDLVYALVPAMRATREAYAGAEERVDERFGAGLLAFSDAAQAAEIASLQDEERLRRKRQEHKEKVQQLVAALRKAYAERDKLWENYQKSAAQIVDRTKAALQELPDEIEQRVVHWEKKCKELEKEDQSSLKASQNMLSTFLGKLA